MKWTVVKCDRCGLKTDLLSVKDDEGWLYREGKDFCPDCYEKLHDLEISHQAEIKVFFGKLQKGGG